MIIASAERLKEMKPRSKPNPNVSRNRDISLIDFEAEYLIWTNFKKFFLYQPFVNVVGLIIQPAMIGIVNEDSRQCFQKLLYLFRLSGKIDNRQRLLMRFISELINLASTPLALR